jgi:hypothetical protein
VHQNTSMREGVMHKGVVTPKGVMTPFLDSRWPASKTLPAPSRVASLKGIAWVYRGTSPIRKRTPLGPYRRPMPRVVGGSWGGGRCLMGEVPL